jgi:hypothetical protein
MQLMGFVMSGPGAVVNALPDYHAFQKVGGGLKVYRLKLHY